MNATEILTDRVLHRLADRQITVKRMFGGITFMLNGNMLCCVSRKGLMVRVGVAAEAVALAKPHAALCLGAGRPLAGFIQVEPPGVATDQDLEGWVNSALAYVERLPPKRAKPAAGR